MPIEFLSDERKAWLQSRASQKIQQADGTIRNQLPDTLALLYEIRVLRKALTISYETNDGVHSHDVDDVCADTINDARHEIDAEAAQ